jgi:hypothetical protein
MKLKIIMALLLINLNTVVNSKVTSEAELFSVYCEAEQSTGFNWKSNNWKQTNFKTNKYVVSKVRKNKDYLLCTIDEKPLITDKFKMNEACYSIRKLGTEISWINVNKCWETWKIDNDSNFLERVSCDVSSGRMHLQPNGWFHRNYLHGVMDGEDKDSLLVSIGKCSKI